MSKFIVLLVVLLAANLAASAQAEQINWATDFKQAQTLARESGRPLLLDFTAAWCKPCKEMDRTFWVLPEVVEAMKPFVAVKVDFDSQKNLVGKYSVGAIPFVVFADPLGNMITFRRGFSSKNVRDLNLIFSEMPKDFSLMKDAYNKLELDKNDSQSLLVIADFYTKSKMTTLANDYYKRALKTDQLKTDAAQQERIAYIVASNYFFGQNFAEAVEPLKDFLKDYPSTPNRERSLSMLAISYARTGKEKEALKYLDAVKKEFPESKNIQVINQAIEFERLKKDKK